MKKRSILALSLVLTTIFQLSAVAISPAVPMESINVNVEVQRALAGITDVAVTAEQRENVAAYIIDENGNEQDVDVAITIREMPSKGRSAEKVYAMTGVAQFTKYNSATPNDLSINVIAYGTLYYTEGGIFVGHTLKKMNGGWSVGPRNVALNCKVVYGGFSGQSPSTKIIRPIGHTFEEISNVTSSKIGLESTADVTLLGTTSTETLKLRLYYGG